MQEKKDNFFVRIKKKWVEKKNLVFSAIDERSKSVSHAKAKRVLFFVFVLFLAVLFIAFYLTLGKMISSFIEDQSAFKQWLDGFGTASIFIFLALRIIQTVTKVIPGSALEIAAGFIFGIWWGFVWCMLGSFLGSIIILWIGKKYGVKIVGLFVDPQKLHVAKENRKKRDFAFFIMYMIPIAPKDVFTWVASVTDDKFGSFLLTTMLARIPSVLISTWCGATIMAGDYTLTLILVGALLFVTVGAIVFYKIKNRKNSKKAGKDKEEIDEKINEREG